jgi:hypothetical protein
MLEFKLSVIKNFTAGLNKTLIKTSTLLLLLLLSGTVIGFQNCSKVQFEGKTDQASSAATTPTDNGSSVTLPAAPTPIPSRTAPIPSSDPEPISPPPTYYKDPLIVIKESIANTADAFGSSVALSAAGDILAVAAPGSRTVSVYKWNAEKWSLDTVIAAPNPNALDPFGAKIALSGDGTTLAIAETQARGIARSGAVYVFRRKTSGWINEDRFQVSDVNEYDAFGSSLAISNLGDTLAVGAYAKDNYSGTVYVYNRDSKSLKWTAASPLKAKYPHPKTYFPTHYGDLFGESVSLSSDGKTLAVSARLEASSTNTINGDQTRMDLNWSGAVFVFELDKIWSQKTYIKASNAQANAMFGSSVSISGDGNTLAIQARQEGSLTTGIHNQDHQDATQISDKNLGAGYIFIRSGATWTQEAFIKPAGNGWAFRDDFTLSRDGNLLVADAGGYTPQQSYTCFKRTAGKWSVRIPILNSEFNSGINNISAVAITADGNTIAFGDPQNNYNGRGIDVTDFTRYLMDTGAVYVGPYK